MEEIGKVIEIKENEAIILLDSSSACGDCSSCGSSGTESGPKSKLLTLPNTIDANINDLVVLSLSGGKTVSITALVYIFPIAMMILFYIIGTRFSSGELNPHGDNPIAILFSISALVLSFVIIYFLDKVLGKRKKLTPELVRLHLPNTSTDDVKKLTC